MRVIELSGMMYSIPTCWEEITLGKQILVVDNNSKYETETQKKIGMLSAYSSIPFPILKRINVSELKDLFKAMSFINTPLPKVPCTEFKFNKEIYYVGQNLLNQEFQDYISLQNIIQQYQDNQTLSLPSMIAVMAKKKLENGLLETMDDYDFEKRAEEFKQLDIVTANGIALFFSQNINELSQLFQQFSNPKEIVEMKMVEVENTLKNQAGQGLLTKCVNGILRWYLRYIKRKLNKHYTF